MNRDDVIKAFEFLAEEGAIVEDGTWAYRYIDNILDPDKAAVAAIEAISGAARYRDGVCIPRLHTAGCCGCGTEEAVA